MTTTMRIDVHVASPGTPGPSRPAREDTPVHPIGAAARLAGMHPQTLRQYDRLGLVVPQRASGRGRRYSARDIANLREVQRLSAEEGINLAGIARILELERENRRLRQRIESLQATVSPGQRVFAVASSGTAVPLARGQRPARSSQAPATATSGSRAIILWRA